MIRASRLRAQTAALAIGVSSSACIITTADDTADGTGPVSTSTNLPADTGHGDTSDPTVPDPTDTSTPDGDTGIEPPSGECTENLLLDPGFEGGTPNAVWQEASMLFGTPICDVSCTDMPGAGPHGGAWWAWFGGLENTADFATVAQTLVIPPGDTVVLTFWLEIRSGSGTGNDLFAIAVDNSQVFFVADTDAGEFPNYTQLQVDLTDFADGGEHTIYFDADIAGVGLTSYFLDDVSLVSCVDEVPGSTGAVDSSTGNPTTGVDSSTGGATDTGATDTGTTGTGTTGTGTTSAGT
jgi:hypothetical protein